MYIGYPLPYVHRVPPSPMYIGYPLTYVQNYKTLAQKKKTKKNTQLSGALHAVCLKSAAYGPRGWPLHGLQRRKAPVTKMTQKWPKLVQKFSKKSQKIRKNDQKRPHRAPRNCTKKSKNALKMSKRVKRGSNMIQKMGLTQA